MESVVRHAIRTFDKRYAMYLTIWDGDTWEALNSALLTFLPPSIR